MESPHPLVAYRARHDLSQRALAARLGVPSATLSRWETGERKPEPELLPDITKKTGIQPGALRPDLARLFAVVRGRPKRARRKRAA